MPSKAALLYLICFCLLITAVVCQPTHLKNITIAVPEDGREYEATHTLCVDASSVDILIFFFGNYLTHAATVKSQPGDSTSQTVISILTALVCPSSGISRALSALFRCSRTKKSELDQALQAGAVCMLVRSSNWRPLHGDGVRDVYVPLKLVCESQGNQTVPARVNIPSWAEEAKSFMTFGDTRRKVVGNIQGIQQVPLGYEFVHVPRDATLQKNLVDAETPVETIATSDSITKSIFSIFQTVYAAITLYQVRGDQLDRYGYAAFGLTVSPYFFVSILNLLAHLATADYPAIFMVRNDIMEEAEERGGLFYGAVGQLRLYEDDEERPFAKFLCQPEQSDQAMMTVGSLESLKNNSHKDQALSKEEVSPLPIIFEWSREWSIDIPACSRFERTKSPRPGQHHGSNDLYGLTGSGLRGWLLSIVVAALPLVIVGALSNFSPGSSTKQQRGWTMAWLTTNIVFGPYMQFSTRVFSALFSRRNVPDPGLAGTGASLIKTCGPIVVPAIGGFVTVGKMINEFGSCVRLY